MITIRGVGPNLSSFTSPHVNHSSSGRILSLAIAADPNRLYAGTYAGVWRSDDAGQSWRQLTGPVTDTAGPGIFGGISVPRIFDLAASPADPDVVLAAALGGRFVASRDGIYRSPDGGTSWELVHRSTAVSQVVFAPDDPTLAFAALGGGIGVSRDAGRTWQVASPGGTAWHVAVGPLESSGVRRVYAAGDSRIWYSSDGGATWTADTGIATIAAGRKATSDFQVACQVAAGQDPRPLGGWAGRTSEAVGNAPQILAVEPGNPARVYLATTGGANGPSYYNRQGIPPDGTPCNTDCARLAGEASLWLGDFGQFDSTGMAQWQQLPGPPVYTGGSTPSGNAYVVSKATSAGFLLFFSDTSHVHVAAGTPTAHASWHRLEGQDVSATEQAGQHGNVLLVHVDPHALVTTPDFEITLQPASGVNPPFDQNSVLAQHLGGTIWMANDGGVYRSGDGGQTWQPAAGLETLDPVNIAGLFGRGSAPALYFGCGDNDDFFSRDGGATWGDPHSACGDCDAWFADVAQPGRVLELTPRSGLPGVKGTVNIITSSDPSKYPDAADPSANHFIPATRLGSTGKPRSEFGPYPSSGFVLAGYRPLIRTLATEAPLPDGDYVFIDFKDDVTAVLLRTTAISSIAHIDDWDDPAKAQQIGPPLPPGANIVQASGGHQHPVYYIGSTMGGKVWKLDEGSGTWRTIVPGGPPGQSASFAFRFFVDPFRPELVHLVDLSGIKVSLDGGESWLPEPGLSLAATAGGRIRSPSSSVIVDMLFSRGESRTRFAFGDAGVLCTINGFEWFTVLDALSIPGRPESGFFDPLSDPADRALYVVVEGRSVLRLGGIPGPPPFQPQPPPVYGLLELAAMLEA